LQQWSDGAWIAIGMSATTDRRGYLRRAVSASRGAKLRIWYTAGRLSSPVLVVR
jgi:hypothetical protein